VTAVSVTDGSPLPGVPASEVAAPRRRPSGSGFWPVAFAFLVVMAVATLPSPLYGLYRTRDHLLALTITVVFAIFAGSTIAVLQWDSAIAARIGRRGMMLAAVATMMLATAVLAAWKDLPGLLIGRVITGVSVGLAAGIAITYLVELRLRADPKASVVQARTIGTSVTIGALGVGPLIAGCLAQWVPQPLTVPYLVFIGLGVVGLAGLRSAPETGTPAPAAAAVTATTGLALFLISGALIGAGSGAVFKGTSGIVLEASPPESRVAMTSDLLIALYVGLSVPVIGAGIALDLGASAPNTVLGFAVLVGLGVVGSGWAMLGRRP
jgi:Sugar (and other) transporter